MANPFLSGSDHKEIETAILYDKALIHDIGKAVAFTDGNRLFINTDDNLAMILPDYNQGMLKWLLWHERMHIELKHHNRFFKYVEEFEKEMETSAETFSDGAITLHAKKFNITKEEVNIIMDILVHDWMSSKFPELVETAMNNLAQFRNRNSLKYTFKTYTLEEMLDEYSKYKHGETGDGEGEGEGESKETEEREGEGKGDSKDDKKEESTDDKKDKAGDGEKKEDKSKKGHSEGGKDTADDRKSKAEDGEPEIKDDAERPDTIDEHDKTDWSKLKEIDSKEFIEKEEADRYENEINKLKRKKLKMGRLTHTLNGLATTKRDRTYRLPSMLQTGDGCIFKGKTPGRVELYLIFDASGSMSGDMNTFKEIISKSIPQAMNCPCEWFAGYNDYHEIKPYKREHGDGYYKAKFKDFMSVRASSGFDDDGDRTIELCYLAEQMGYSPIGVTDGGGQLSWSKDKLKKLKRTILVGQNGYWLKKCKEVNPNIQILEIDI